MYPVIQLRPVGRRVDAAWDDDDVTTVLGCPRCQHVVAGDHASRGPRCNQALAPSALSAGEAALAVVPLQRVVES